MGCAERRFHLLEIAPTQAQRFSRDEDRSFRRFACGERAPPALFDIVNGFLIDAVAHRVGFRPWLEDWCGVSLQML